VIGIVVQQLVVEGQVGLVGFLGQAAGALVITAGDHVGHDVKEITGRRIDVLILLTISRDPPLGEHQDVTRGHPHRPLDREGRVVAQRPHRDRRRRQQQRLLVRDGRKQEMIVLLVAAARSPARLLLVGRRFGIPWLVVLFSNHAGNPLGDILDAVLGRTGCRLPAGWLGIRNRRLFNVIGWRGIRNLIVPGVSRRHGGGTQLSRVNSRTPIACASALCPPYGANRTTGGLTVLGMNGIAASVPARRAIRSGSSIAFSPSRTRCQCNRTVHRWRGVLTRRFAASCAPSWYTPFHKLSSRSPSRSTNVRPRQA